MYDPDILQALKNHVWSVQYGTSYRDTKWKATFRAAYRHGGKEGKLYKIYRPHKVLKCQLCKGRKKHTATYADYTSLTLFCTMHAPINTLWELVEEEKKEETIV